MLAKKISSFTNNLEPSKPSTEPSLKREYISRLACVSSTIIHTVSGSTSMRKHAHTGMWKCTRVEEGGTYLWSVYPYVCRGSRSLTCEHCGHYGHYYLSCAVMKAMFVTQFWDGPRPGTPCPLVSVGWNNMTVLMDYLKKTYDTTWNWCYLTSDLTLQQLETFNYIDRRIPVKKSSSFLLQTLHHTDTHTITHIHT